MSRQLEEQDGSTLLVLQSLGKNLEWVQYTGNNNKASNMDGQKLGWKNEQELGNSSQVGGK